MSRSRAVSCLLCFVLIFGVLGGLVGAQVALAAKEGGNGAFLSLPSQEAPEIEETVELSAQYPVLRAKSGEAFEFEVEFKYSGKEDRTFELTVIKPPKWVSRITPQYDSKEISAIRMKPFTSLPEKVKVIAVPFPWDLPEPGDYMITLEVSSGDIKGSIELKAVVTARYEMDFYTETGRLNTKVTAGEENHLAVKVRNSGSATIEKINLTSSKPEGWTIKFNPEKVESLDPELAQDVDVIIKPPAKTIAGDYSITLKADSKEVSERMEIRVTVLTPTIWGWVGIIIVVVVIAGLAILFRQLGRR